MTLPAIVPRIPTRDDIDALPHGVKGEIIDGVLYAMTRPRFRHQVIAGCVTADLFNPFARGRGGPGGWWIVSEPGIELPRSPEISPDIAGWRRERMPSSPEGPVTIVPDWVCEVLSTTTRRHNLRIKLPYYASIGVPYAWVIDLDAQLLQAHRLSDGHWLQIGTFADEKDARIEPFDAVAIDVSEWWQDLEREEPRVK